MAVNVKTTQHMQNLVQDFAWKQARMQVVYEQDDGSMSGAPTGYSRNGTSGSSNGHGIPSPPNSSNHLPPPVLPHLPTSSTMPSSIPPPPANIAAVLKQEHHRPQPSPHSHLQQTQSSQLILGSSTPLPTTLIPPLTHSQSIASLGSSHSHSESSTPEVGRQPRRSARSSRKKTNVACTNCVLAKAGCDPGRPCKRCQRLQKTNCVDREVTDKKKTPNKRSRRSSEDGDSDDDGAPPLKRPRRSGPRGATPTAPSQPNFSPVQPPTLPSFSTVATTTSTRSSPISSFKDSPPQPPFPPPPTSSLPPVGISNGLPPSFGSLEIPSDKSGSQSSILPSLPGGSTVVALPPNMFQMTPQNSQQSQQVVVSVPYHVLQGGNQVITITPVQQSSSPSANEEDERKLLMTTILQRNGSTPERLTTEGIIRTALQTSWQERDLFACLATETSFELMLLHRLSQDADVTMNNYFVEPELQQHTQLVVKYLVQSISKLSDSDIAPFAKYRDCIDLSLEKSHNEIYQRLQRLAVSRGLQMRSSSQLLFGANQTTVLPSFPPLSGSSVMVSQPDQTNGERQQIFRILTNLKTDENSMMLDNENKMNEQ